MRFAFVTPRFGKNIGAGAETLVRELASKISDRCDDVEILTTTAKDNRTWENELPSGESIEQGLRVRRFPVDPRDLEKWIPTQISISEGMQVSIEAQLEWLDNSVNSKELYRYIALNHSRYDALFFAIYFFGTTFYGAQIAPQKSILIPCLHDEPYAYLDSMRALFNSVQGVLWNAYPERVLSTQLFGDLRGGVVGMGFEPFDAEYVAGLEPFFDADFPYVLYLGRKETGKNVQHLIDLFVEAKAKLPELSALKLVVAGSGSFTDLYRDNVLARGDIIDVEQLSERDKHRIIKHALYLVQPSRNESFGIVLMEAWMLGTAVLVDSLCAVTRYQVEQSRGGLYYSSALDLAGVISEALNNPALKFELASHGLEYVKREYSWGAVLSRFDAVMENILGAIGQKRSEQKKAGKSSELERSFASHES